MAKKVNKVVVAPKSWSRSPDEELLKVFNLKFKIRGCVKANVILPENIR